MRHLLPARRASSASSHRPGARAGVPLRPVAPGVIARTVLAWATATAIPVIAIAEIAWGMINGDTPRTEATAWSLIFLAVRGARRRSAGDRDCSEVDRRANPLGAQGAGGRRGGADGRRGGGQRRERGRAAAGGLQPDGGRLRERERLQDLFGRHVGEDVARRALAAGVELGGEVREAAVLFVDVVGSTALAESVARRRWWSS